MQSTHQQVNNPQTSSGYAGIPTRIADAKEVPPLVVDRDEAVREEVISRLEVVSHGLAGTHRACAEAYLSQAMYEEALPHLKAAAQFGGGNLEYCNQLGYVQYLVGDDAGAIDCFQEVIRQQPGNADALFNLGMVLFGQESLIEAEDCFRRALDVRPDDSETWNNRGVCLFQQGRSAEARACFERAIQIDPANTDASFNLQSC